MHKIYFKVFISFFIVLFFSSQLILAQSIPNDIDSLSDDEIKSYWNQAKAQGYTVDQLKAIALSKGVSPDQIASFESRVSSLGATEVGLQGEQIDATLAVSNTNPVGFTGTEISRISAEDPLFGYAFFNNQNITFAPNLNLATPKNYELGPGDELVINIWGASDSSSIIQIDREGTLRVPNVGPVYVSGMTIENATTTIINKLKRVYGGIEAPDSSPYKVHVSVSLVNVRSVQVNIIGEVKVPGTYTLSSLSTILNGLYAAGGPTKEGTFRDIKLIRNGEEVSTFDVYQYLIKGSQKGNKTLQDQDVIIVSPYISRINITGAVKRSGVYELLENEDFADLLKYVSGFKANAYKELIVLERIKGDRRVLKEITYENMVSENLTSGDRIFISAIINEFENKITISGAVYRPGDYEFTPGLTIVDLIKKASGLRETAYKDRGIIYRKNSKIDKYTLKFSLEDVMEGKTELLLQPDDVIRVFDASTFRDEYNVSIRGAVRNPSSFPYFEGITIEDLILQAGGFTDGANPQKIDIHRFVKDDDFETLAESITISIDRQLKTLNNEQSFKLLPKDKISVRSLKGYGERKDVIIEGEVNYPGAYLAESNTDRISDIIARAGGLSPFAFAGGASLVRANPYYKDVAQKLTSKDINDSQSGNLDINNRREFRIGIDLKEILSEGGVDSKSNLILKEGDRIIIPSIKETVKTEGNLFIPSLIRYEKDWTLLDYIGKSGGFAEDAKKSKIYVVHANGDIASTKRFLFFRSYPNILPGTLIIVPKKKERTSNFSTQEAVGIGTGLASFALLLDRILK